MTTDYRSVLPGRGRSIARASVEPASRRIGEEAGAYELGLAEHELVALWLLGRVPTAVLPWPLLRAGRAGRGPGPDVREAAFRHPSGVPLVGDIEVHLRASDFVRHGHATDPAYDGVVLHLVWTDDRPLANGEDREDSRGTPTALPGGDYVLTVEVGPALGGDSARLRELVRLGPSGGEPCEGWAASSERSVVTETVGAEGRRRLAERAWGAGRLVELNGWEGAWEELLIRALRSSAGRRHETDGEQRALAARVNAALVGSAATPDGPRVMLPALERLARTRRPAAIIEALRLPGGESGRALGRARATEIGWNAALPLLAATAAAYGDRELAAQVAALIAAWPAPRPYGRTDALARLIRPAGPTPRGGGALYAQGLLHVQDLWCERGGCGVCPLSPRSGVS